MAPELSQLGCKVIAHIHNPYTTKFGIPRQSGIVEEVESTIVFTPEYRNADALRGIEGYSHLWLVWVFSEAIRDGWYPTVLPQRLGGKTRMGVFATRSPFRPNEIGLSCVKLVGIEQTADSGTVIHVAGADLMDGTPILDIKPYIPYSDCHPDATGGFTATADDFLLEVQIPYWLLDRIPKEKHSALIGVLSHDPRPSYQKDSDRIYGLDFAEFNIRFQGQNKILTVTEITKNI